MAGPLIGAVLGTISIGTGFLFGATLWGSILSGAIVGYAVTNRKKPSIGGGSPTYSFEQLSNTMAQTLPIPIVYGKCRVAGNVFYQSFYDDKKEKVDQYIGISEGPVQSISDVMFNDLVPASLSGCSYNIYLNTDDDTHDSRDPATGARPYPNDMAAITTTAKAQDKLSGNITITSIVEGRLVWTPDGVKYSRNPVWIIRDLLTNTRYGLGIPEYYIDDDIAAQSAAYCDELIEDDPRFALDYVVDTQETAIDHIENMLSCFRGYVICRDKIEIRVEAPVTTYTKKIGLDNIIEGSFTWWQSSNDDIYNRVIIEWIDPDNHYERSTSVFDVVDDIERRGVVDKTFSLLGITSAKQAARMGAFLIDSSNYVRNFCSFSLALQDADVEVGDVVAITHDLPGWTDKWMRIISIDDTKDDEIIVICAEYVAEVYNDRAMDYVEHVDTNLDYSYSCPNVTNLNTEEQIQVAPDGTVISNIYVSWTDPPVLLANIEVLILEEGAISYRSCGIAAPGVQNFVIRGLKSNQTVTVMARATNSLGIKSIGATKQLVLWGKAAPPGEPTDITISNGVASIRIDWANPTDADFDHVDIVEYKGLNRPTDVNQGTLVASVSGTSITRGGLEEIMVYWYWLRAVDTSGNTSDYVGPFSGTTKAYTDSVLDFEFDESMLAHRLSEDILANVLQNDEDYHTSYEKERKLAHDINNEVETRELQIATMSNDVVAMQAQILELFNAQIEGRVATLTELTDLLNDLANTKATVDNLSVAVINEQVYRATADETLGQEIDAVRAKAEQNEALIAQEQIVRATEDSALASEINLLDSRLDSAESSIQNFSIVIGTGDDTLAERVVILNSKFNKKMDDEELNRELTGEAALEGIIQNDEDYQAEKNRHLTHEAMIRQEQTTRANQDEALAQTISAVQSKANDNAALIYNEQITRANADKALSQYIDIIRAENNKIEATVYQERTARITGDEALAEDVTALQSNINNVSAALQTEQTTRANADSALSSSITTLQSQVTSGLSSLQSAVTQTSQALALLDGTVRSLWTIQTQAIGEKKAVAGIGLFADGQSGTSEFTILTDKFFVYNPSDGTIKPVFQLINNVAYLKGDIIASGTITSAKLAANSVIAEKINVSSLSSITANMGTLTSGKIQSSDGKFVIDLTNKFISIEV